MKECIYADDFDNAPEQFNLGSSQSKLHMVNRMTVQSRNFSFIVAVIYKNNLLIVLDFKNTQLTKRLFLDILVKNNLDGKWVFLRYGTREKADRRAAFV